MPRTKNGPGRTFVPIEGRWKFEGNRATFLGPTEPSTPIGICLSPIRFRSGTAIVRAAMGATHQGESAHILIGYNVATECWSWRIWPRLRDQFFHSRAGLADPRLERCLFRTSSRASARDRSECHRTARDAFSRSCSRPRVRTALSASGQPGRPLRLGNRKDRIFRF
jgi:hypothetical protein